MKSIWIVFFLLINYIRAFNQIPDLPDDNVKARGGKEVIIAFFEKEYPHGNPYLAPGWQKGNAELTSHTLLPERDMIPLFNFDKVENRLYYVNGKNEIIIYPIDSIIRFEIITSNVDYKFEKVTWISSKYFLMPIITSKDGYSLYKRMFTKIIGADFKNEGYSASGKKYDEFVDYYEYYLIYPGNKSYKKVDLNEKNIRKALIQDAKLVDEFFSLNEVDINEQNLLGIIQYIDDKKYPE